MLARLPLILTLAALPAAAEPVAIAMLGDSLTQGNGLMPEDGLVPQLQDWLTERGAAVTLINAGVSGDTTAGGLSRIGWTLADDPDGVVVALGGNDMLRGIDPAVSRENLAGILDAAAAAGVPALLVGIDAPANYGPEFEADFEAMFRDLAGERDLPLIPNLLAPILAAEDPVRLMQDDQIHPNAAGVEAIVEALGPAVLAFAEDLGACAAGCSPP